MCTIENYLDDMEEFEPTLFATQGGGYVEWNDYNHFYFFVKEPPQGYEIGSVMPDEWGVIAIPANQRSEILSD